MELALILPVLLLLILGTVDFARAIMLYNGVSEAAREGARAGQVQLTPNPTVTAAPEITAAQATAVAAAARAHVEALGAPLAVTTTAGTGAAGPYVQVVVATTYEPIAGQFLGVGALPVAATSRQYLP